VQAEWLVFFAKPMEKRPTRVCCRRDSQQPSPMNFALYYFLRSEVFGSRQLIVPVFTSCYVEMRILVRKIRVSIHIGGKIRGAASRLCLVNRNGAGVARPAISTFPELLGSVCACVFFASIDSGQSGQLIFNSAFS
jgi:hypothetical protein